MLDYSGERNKTLVEQEVIKVDELAKLLGITLPKGVVSFELAEKKKGKGVDNQARKVFLISRRFSISGYVGDNPVTINYYKKRTGKKGEYNYIDQRLTVFRNQMTVRLDASTATGKELVLLYMIHPDCEQSPFRDPKKRPSWRMVDFEAKALAQTNKDKAKNDILTLIYGNPKNVVMAKGMIVGDKSIANIPMEQGQATLELTKLLDSTSVDAFTNAWNDPVTQIRGTVRLAEEKKVISYSEAGGLGRWMFGKKELLEVAPANDREKTLIEFLKKNSDTYTEILSKC
jgi:hypothetical protein